MREGRQAAPWYRHYVLLVVGLIAVFDYFDRNLLTILVEPIKRDLHFSNSQMGLLMGFGFALMYSILGVPCGRLADRYGRSRVIAWSIAIWSVATAASGLAGGFAMLLLARIGVGIGESGAYPSMQALVADYFPAKHRGTALAVLGAFGAAGLSLALALGGLAADRWGWRAAFLAASAPGAVLSVLVFLTIGDAPERVAQADAGRRQALPLGVAIRTLARRKAFSLLCLGVAFAVIAAYGWEIWTPTYLMLGYGLSAGELGTRYAAVVGPVLIVAILAGGFAYDRLVKRDPRWALWIIALAFGIAAPLNVAIYLVHDFNLVLVLAAFGTFFGNVWVAPAYAAVQDLAGPKLRALSAAVFMMIVNIVGVGLGPIVPGVLSDALEPRFGERSLAVSLCLLALLTAASMVPLLRGACSYQEDVRDANR